MGCCAFRASQIMQCGGFGAHKPMEQCMRNGGCGHEFDWNNLKPLRFGKPGEPANDRQVRSGLLQIRAGRTT